MPTFFYQSVVPRSNCVVSRHVESLTTGRLPKHSVRSVKTNSTTCHTTGMWVGSEVLRQFSTIEMARRLGNWPRLEMQTVIRILWAKNVSVSDIHSQIVEVYGEEEIIR
ncbi:hypothetical protein TNCV_4368471 [Trichonephila clavipes]|nr:hypothetical protein TNCV_4368471 [Trichonephila clavipes]